MYAFVCRYDRHLAGSSNYDSVESGSHAALAVQPLKKIIMGWNIRDYAVVNNYY